MSNTTTAVQAIPSSTVPRHSVYNPNAPVPWWHRTMELTTICVINSLTLIIIIIRVWARRVSLKRFRPDDIWIAVAGLILVFPHWICQIGTNRYGSGLHSYNLPDSWVVPYWRFSWGWIGYYIVCAMIKVSICYCLLEILPAAFNRVRLLIYGLCVVSIGSGIAESCLWLFQCSPFLSNFIITVPSKSCADIDVARYIWVGVSFTIDIILVMIPFFIFNQARFKPHERYALLIVFGASLLGTCTCLFGIYGIWKNRLSQAHTDLTYTDTVFVMVNDIEILMYTIGASATVSARYIVSKAAAISNNSSIRAKMRGRKKSKPAKDSNPYTNEGSTMIELTAKDIKNFESTATGSQDIMGGLGYKNTSTPSWFPSDDDVPMNANQHWPHPLEHVDSRMGVLPESDSDRTFVYV